MKKTLILSSILFLCFINVQAKNNEDKKPSLSETKKTKLHSKSKKNKQKSSSKEKIEELTNEITKLQLKLQFLEAKAKIADESGEYEKSEKIEKEVKKTEGQLKKVFIKTASILGTLGGTVGAALTTFLIALITSWIKNFTISSITNTTTPNNLENNSEHFHFHCPSGESEYSKKQITEVMKSSIKNHLINNEEDRNEIVEKINTLENLPIQNPWLNQIKSTIVNSVIQYGIQAGITIIWYKIQASGLK